MKNKLIISLFIATLFLTGSALSQTKNLRESLAVLHIDAPGFTLTPEQMGNLTRVELSKLNMFDVIDRYDIQYLLEQNNINPENCYGKMCLIEAGKKLNSDKMFTGSVEVLGEKIAITFRLLDVGTGQVEITQVMEFLNLRKQVQTMIGLTIQKMFDKKVDENLLNKLTKQFDYESAVNVPTASTLNLSGPRMGVTLFSGEVAEILKKEEAVGGYDVIPVMFQFGYQFEVKYLNEGNFQALFEFIPTITGLDQGKFIPSIALLNGLRSNKSGFEFAFGPTFNVIKEAEGYFDENNDWRLKEEFEPDPVNPEPNPFPIEKRLDSRGEYILNTGFVFAIGKTFKSGKLNIPVNGFFIPGKDGHRFGLSVGFNASSFMK